MPAKYDDKDGYEMGLVPTMALNVTLSCMAQSEDDTERIRDLKTKPFPTQIYSGKTAVEDCLKTMISHSFEAARRVHEIRKAYEKHKLTVEEEQKFQAATHCDSCEKEFIAGDKKLDKVRDHGHLTSRRLRFILCKSCNGKFKNRYEHILLSYGGKNFDHLPILRTLMDCQEKRRPSFYRLSIIPTNTRKVLTIRLIPFCEFCDSQNSDTGVVSRRKRKQKSECAEQPPPCNYIHPVMVFYDFLSQIGNNGSLSSLIENLRVDCDSGSMTEKARFPVTYTNYVEMGLEGYIEFRDCIAKQIFPYQNYKIDSDGEPADDFLKRTMLPTKDEWIQDAGCTEISDKEYDFAIKIWKGLEKWCKNKGEVCTIDTYLQFYLITDVYLLAELCLATMEENYKRFKLYLPQFLSLPSYAYNVFLNECTEQIELLTDQRIYDHFSAPIAGLVSNSGLRLIRANRPDIPEHFEINHPTSIIMFYDCCSLYPFSCTFSLSNWRFSMLSDAKVKQIFKNITENQWHLTWTDDYCYRRYDENGKEQLIGLSFSVDIECPKTHHFLFDQMPLFGERKKIEDSSLSLWQKNLKNKMNLKTERSEKIVMSLERKKRVNCDYRYLKMALELGYKLNSIHEIVELEMSFVMKNFVEKMGFLRKNAKTEIGSLFCKFMINSITGRFGMTGQQHLKCSLATDYTSFQREIKKHSVKNFISYGKESGLFIHRKRFYHHKNPSHMYYTLLSISKMVMAKWLYYHCVIQFSGSFLTKQIYTDTDSSLVLLTSLRNEKNEKDHWDTLLRYYEILRNLAPFLDFYNWPENHPFINWNTTEAEKNLLLELRTKNRKKPGCFSSELKGSFEAFSGVFFCAKSYSIATKDIMSNETIYGSKLTMKGVRKKNFPKKHKDLLRFFLGNKFNLLYTHSYIGSKDYELHYKVQTKAVVSRYYDKRYVLRCGNISLSYGHCMIPIIEAVEQLMEDMLVQITQ